MSLYKDIRNTLEDTLLAEEYLLAMSADRHNAQHVPPIKQEL